jgi:hypothetical protein
LAVSGFGALAPISRWAGFSSGSSSSSVAALKMVVSLVRLAGSERNVPRSVSVYSSRRMAADSAWMGKAMYWWYQVE